MDAEPVPPGRVIPLVDPGFGDRERAAVDRVMRSGRITAGEETAAFEDEFAAAAGLRTAVAVGNGTAALHLAMLALGIGPGDEVIVPSLTFVATASVVRLVGARPVFVDVIGPRELTLDPVEVGRALGPRTRAIVAVHYGGWLARMAQLRSLADAAGVALVEDAAHAPLVAGPDGMSGTMGDVGCFSFHATKNMAVGEGGMVVARDAEVSARVRRLRAHGMTGPTGALGPGGRPCGYDVPEPGLNYRPTDLGSAIGRVQLARLGREQAARRTVTVEYRRLAAGSALQLPFDLAAPSAHHLMPVLLPERTDRARAQAVLTRYGIGTGVHYPPVHLFSAYRPGPVLERTEGLAPRLLSLPLHGRMRPGDVDRVMTGLMAAVDVASTEGVVTHGG